MTQTTQFPHIPFFPSSVNEFLSVSYKGKTHELPHWQKTAIILSSIAGVALFGIGILFGLGLSYYFRSRFVQQIAMDNAISIQIQGINQPKKTNPVVVTEPPKSSTELEPISTDTETQIVKSNPIEVIEPSKSPLLLQPVLTDTETQIVKSNPIEVIEPLKSPLLLQPVLTDTPVQTANSESPLTTTQIEEDLTPTKVANQTPQVVPVLDDALIKEQVEEIRNAIDKTRLGVVSLKDERINGTILEKWSMEGRHFLSITNGIRGHKIPDFSPLLLPKGIYCIYFTNTDNITKEFMRNDAYNETIIDKFGADNVYHLIICEHNPKWDVSSVKKIHKHQLELYAKKSIHDQINQNCIKEFEKHLTDTPVQTAKSESPLTTTQSEEDLKPTKVANQTPQVAPVRDDALIKEQVEEIRMAIDKTRRGFVSLNDECINDTILEKWSMEGRHFLSITNGIRGHKIPDFSPLLLPKGIYCIYFTNTDNITKEFMRNDAYNETIIDKFGADNVYHLIICEHNPKWDISSVNKIHNHQLELYAKKSIHDQINQNCIKEFEKHLQDQGIGMP